jgi:hypothetical protein
VQVVVNMCLCFLFAPVRCYTFNALIWSGRRWLQTIHDTVGKLVVLPEIPLDPVNLDLNSHPVQAIESSCGAVLVEAGIPHKADLVEMGIPPFRLQS